MVDSFEPSGVEPEPALEAAGLPVVLAWMGFVALVLIGLEIARRFIESS